MNHKLLKVLAISFSAASLMGTVVSVSPSQTSIAAVQTQTKKVSMLAYKDSPKHKSRSKSMARAFIGTSAKLEVAGGKVKKLIVHVDGKNSPMGKGQNVNKIVRALKINGVKGKKAHLSKDNSSFDFVFKPQAFKNNGWAKLTVTIDFSGKMSENAWLKFGKAAGVNTLHAKKPSKKVSK